MDERRLKQQLTFLTEADKMKTVLRRTLLADGSRPENDAEHSWHFALMAMVLYEYAYSPEVDLFRVLKMALLHDMVEIYAGDTFAYDEAANEDKEARERAAADRLFSLLPADQGGEYRALWEEFDAMQTPDSIYAAAIDRFQPLINNYLTRGHTWKLGDVKKSKVYKRMAMVKEGMPELWAVVEYMINNAIEQGFLKE
ncbi:MAG TPA: hypothetical protein DEB31_08385 [Clostridiales bacterium]|nr:hypothetical protein [Clostridiales bacterium]